MAWNDRILLMKTETRDGVQVAYLTDTPWKGTLGSAFDVIPANLPPGTRGVVLDMSELGFISSAGIASIIQFRAALVAKSVDLRIAAPSMFTTRLFEAMGLQASLPIDKTVDDAVAALRQAPPPAAAS